VALSDPWEPGIDEISFVRFAGWNLLLPRHYDVVDDRYAKDQYKFHKSGTSLCVLGTFHHSL
jgi:hypothetical protein